MYAIVRYPRTTIRSTSELTADLLLDTAHLGAGPEFSLAR
jgi:hypothetical protein